VEKQINNKNTTFTVFRDEIEFNIFLELDCVSQFYFNNVQSLGLEVTDDGYALLAVKKLG
jgi:hypothetical protein